MNTQTVTGEVLIADLTDTQIRELGELLEDVRNLRTCNWNGKRMLVRDLKQFIAIYRHRPDMWDDACLEYDQEIKLDTNM